MENDVLIKIIRRKRALEVLREEGSMDRGDLEQALGVSKPTVHRFARFFGEQGLLVRENGLFKLTPSGEIIATEIMRFHDTVAGVHKLGRVFQWLPVAEFDFDLRRFHDADIVLPDCNDPLAPVHEASALLDAADRVHVVSSIYIPETFAALGRGVTENGMSVTCVYDSRVVDVIRGNEQARGNLGQFLAHGGVVAVHPGTVPFAIGIVDEAVLIGAVDDGGVPQALVVTEDSVVREWAEETCETYLREADPVSVETDRRAMVPGQPG